MKQFVIEASSFGYLVKKYYLTKYIGEEFTLDINQAFKGNSFEIINRLNTEIEDDKFNNVPVYKYKIVNIKDINNE